MPVNSEKKVRISNSQQNRIDILNIIRMEGPTSRVDIATAIGLTKPTVTIVTNDMLEKNILTERGIQPKEQALSRGRRKILLDINESYRLAFGVCVDKGRLSIGVANLKGQSLDKTTVSIEGKEYREVLETIVNVITSLFKGNYIPAYQVLGVGICISDGCANFIDAPDKLARLKRDLSHAISFKIITDSTMNGVLRAERIFKTTHYSSTLLLRYGNVIENGLWINGDVYRSNTGNAGGFKTLQSIDHGTSYERFLYECDVLDEDECKQRLNARLARDIKQCHDILDTEAVILMGDYFEKQIDSIGEVLKSQSPLRLIASIVTEESLYLAGCAIAIEQYFDKIGGF